MKISLRAFTIFIDKSGKVALDSGVSGLPFLLAARVAKDQVQHDRSAALAVKWAYKVAPLLEDSLMVADSYYCSKDALDFLLEEKHAFLLSVPKGQYYHIRRKLNPHIKLKNDFTYAWNKRTGVMFCQVLDANLGRNCVITNAYGIKKRARPLRMEDSSELVEDVVIRNAPALPTFENVNERQSGYSRENPSGWSASASSSDKEGEEKEENLLGSRTFLRSRDCGACHRNTRLHGGFSFSTTCLLSSVTLGRMGKTSSQSLRLFP